MTIRDHKTNPEQAPDKQRADISTTSNIPVTSEPRKTKPDTRQKYIPIEDIIAYRQKNLTHAEISALVGCSPANVTQRLQQADIQGLENYKQYKDVAFESLQRDISKNITLRDIQKAPLQSKILAMGVLQDKIQALRGQATDIIQVNQVTATLSEITTKMRNAGIINADKVINNSIDTQVVDV
jgi:hypothetical protein